jgi:hypothetical protein
MTTEEIEAKHAQLKAYFLEAINSPLLTYLEARMRGNEKEGVYILYDVFDQPVYVGTATDIADRLKVQREDPKRSEILHKLPEEFHGYVFGALFKSIRIFLIEGWYRLALETYLMLMLEPPLNIKDLGKTSKREVPRNAAPVRREDSPRSINDPAHFGPNYPT